MKKSILTLVAVTTIIVISCTKQVSKPQIKKSNTETMRKRSNPLDGLKATR